MSLDRNFAATVSTLLTNRSLTQAELAAAMGKSPAYVSHIMTGYRRPAASWADLVADALALDDPARMALHKAAAKDNGFKLD